MNSLKHKMRQLGLLITPRFVKCYDTWVLLRQAWELKKASVNQKDSSILVKTIFNYSQIYPLQIREEIISLLDVLKEFNPRNICELGGKNGGTLFLFSRIAEAEARILSVDMEYSLAQCKVFPIFFAKDHQIVACLKANTHTPNTIKKIHDWFNGEGIDFLFIDGDHTFEGVRQDYEMYAPLVRSGGIIVFHDIIQDHKTRFGGTSNAYSGGVPQFWQYLKAKYQKTREIVNDYNQDGAGIGILFKEG